MPEWWWKQCHYSRKAFAWECFKPFPTQIGIHNTLEYTHITYGLCLGWTRFSFPMCLMSDWCLFRVYFSYRGAESKLTPVLTASSKHTFCAMSLNKHITCIVVHSNSNTFQWKKRVVQFNTLSMEIAVFPCQDTSWQCVLWGHAQVNPHSCSLVFSLCARKVSTEPARVQGLPVLGNYHLHGNGGWGNLTTCKWAPGICQKPTHYFKE